MKLMRDLFLERDAGSFGGALTPKEKIVRDRKLAEAGRELNRGRLTKEEYNDFMRTLLGGKECV